jgi:hypothetical protein
MDKIKRVIQSLILISLVSCGSLDQKSHDDKKAYKMELLMEINGQKCVGYCVIPKTDILKIKITALDDIDWLIVRTHARSIEKKEATNIKARSFEKDIEKRSFLKGMFLKNNEASFYFTPQYPLETEEYSPIRIQVISSSGVHTYGLINMKDDMDMPGTLSCNGSTGTVQGTAMCQNYKSLENSIRFPQNLAPIVFKVRDTINCKIRAVDERNFVFSSTKGECLFHFRSKNLTNGDNCRGKNSKYCLRLTHYGYETFYVK